MKVNIVRSYFVSISEVAYKKLQKTVKKDNTFFAYAYVNNALTTMREVCKKNGNEYTFPDDFLEKCRLICSMRERGHKLKFKLSEDNIEYVRKMADIYGLTIKSIYIACLETYLKKIRWYKLWNEE